MVYRTAAPFLVLIIVVAVGGLMWTVSLDSATGTYFASGGGRYYYGPQIVQLSPEEACKYAGCQSMRPTTIYTNEFGIKNVVCNCRYGKICVPMVQTAYID